MTVTALLPPVAGEGVTTEAQRREVAELATFVWADAELGSRFLRTPHPLLNGVAPVEVWETEAGLDRVRNLLNGIVHGLPV